MKRKKKHSGAVQGHALLYGRSSRAIRIVNGVEVGSARTSCVKNDGKSRSADKQKHHIVTKVSGINKTVQKKYKMSDEAKRKLDRLQDPLDIMNRSARIQKYEKANSTEKYEYGLSDW